MPDPATTTTAAPAEPNAPAPSTPTPGDVVVRFVAQPIVDLRTGAIPAVELLARPLHGPSIGTWTLDELAARSRRLAHAAFDVAATLPSDVGLVHINVTALDLDESDLAEQLLDRVPGHRGHLVLEVTEQFELRDTRTVRANLRRLRAAGVRFALDDFGDGWASMVTMRLLRPEIVKVTTEGLSTRGRLDPRVATWLRLRSASVGCRQIVLEQIDTMKKVEWANAMGFRLLQGRLLDRYILESLPEQVAAAPLSLVTSVPGRDGAREALAPVLPMIA
jgi:EAL domain-containing protein (putative c-di-GMP-specific phosphodiesterase class I)